MQFAQCAELAKEITAHMIRAPQAAKALIEVLEPLIHDDNVSGDDIIKIFSSVIIYLSKANDITALTAIGTTAGLLALLYADKSPEELTNMATRILAREPCEPEAPSVHVIFMHRGE